ncbi:conjugal transfer protein TraD [Aureimonas sp. AU12]|uniref:conjugal transfer protein TraD n=1 Tax=Aureimonas sp. AU12 TaxID=1638161 RepID=UPI000782CFAE|nr:conjugal transfer protein TraD [Aureimonas sp. AU12]
MALREELRRVDDRPSASARRQDTHQKIALGGLIVKAGLRDADKSFLLGILMEAASRQSDGEFKARMIDLGRKGFAE